MHSTIANSPSSGKLLDQVRLPLLEALYPPHLVMACLTQTRHRQQRQRQLNHLLMVYLLIIASLTPLTALVDVCAGLLRQWRWMGSRLHGAVSAPALCYRRRQLGGKVLRALFHARCRPLAPIKAPGASAFGLHLFALDGTTHDVADTPANVRAFGRIVTSKDPAKALLQSPFPQLRCLYLVEVATRAIVAAKPASVRRSEASLASEVLSALGPGQLVLMDSGFRGGALLQQIMQQGGHAIVRLHPHDYTQRLLTLPDGSYFTRIFTTESRTKTAPSMVVRIIEYELDSAIADLLASLQRSRARSGTRSTVGPAPIYRLATTLLSHHQAPAHEVSACYHERWEAESSIGELKQDLLRVPRFKSKSPTGVIQEVYALLLGHYAIQATRFQASCQHGSLDVDRISFTHTLHVFQHALHNSCMITLGLMPQWKTWVFFDVLTPHRLLPARRLRCYPRVIKASLSRFYKKREKDRGFRWPDKHMQWPDFIHIVRRVLESPPVLSPPDLSPLRLFSWHWPQGTALRELDIAILFLAMSEIL